MSRVNIRIELVIRTERVRNADIGTSSRTRDKQANEQVYVTKHEVARDVANKQVSSDGCQRTSYRGGSKSLGLGRAAISKKVAFYFSVFGSP